MPAFFVRLLALLALLCPSLAQAATCTSTGGNWGAAGTWSCGHVPANGDDVVIASGTTTLNTNSNTLNSLTVNGTLTLGNNGTARTLTVAGDIVVNGGIGLGAAAATHVLVAGGNIVNTGSINLRPAANRLCNVTFNRNGNQTVSGAGSYVFNLIALNMGASRANILDMQSAITVPSPFLTIINGTYKHSSSSNIAPWTANPNIPATGGFWLNSAAAVTTGGINVSGMLRVSNGTMTVGNANNALLSLGNSAATLLQVEGGALTVTGGINSVSNTAAGTFTQSGGTITLQTINAGPLYSLLLGSNTTLNWSGGTIIAVNGNAATNDIDIRSATQNITGGTLQIGSAAATSTNQVSYINGAGGQLNVWDLVIGGSGGAQTIWQRSSINVLNDLTIQSGNTLQPSAGNAINIGAGNASGNWTNNGGFTPGTSTVTFTGSAATATIGGTTATTFYQLAINKAANDLTLNTNATASNLLTFTSGNVVTGANTLIASANCPGGVSRVSGHVVGNLRLTFPATNPVTCVFHVGDANNYSPITVTKTGTNSGTLNGAVTAGDHADTVAGTSGIEVSRSANRYWSLTAGTLASGTPYSATFQFCAAVGAGCAVNDVDTGANTAVFIVAKKTSGTWSLPTVGTRTGISTQATGLNSFGEFAVGEAAGASVAASNFDCIETGLSFTPLERHPLYTKLAGTAFTLDVVALKASGAIETGYVGSGSKTVTLELFDDSAPPATCAAYASPVATQTMTFVPADAGRKTSAAITIANAYGKLRCRVSDAVPVHGCSSDDFTVRPSSFTAVTSGDADADGSGASATATPALKSGAAFALTADTGLTGYNGTPKVNAGLTEWLSAPVGGLASPGTGTVAGSFSAATSGVASGDDFSYDEVGYFRFRPQGVYDDDFASASADIANGDCSNDFSNTLASGKYGCKFGNTAATAYFGRFMPHHFGVVTPVAFVPGCGAFTYLDQPFSLPATIEARNLGNTKTSNYSGAFANGVVGVEIENANSGSAIAHSRLTWGGAWAGGGYSFSATKFSRPAAGIDGPYETLAIGVTVTDETSLAAAARPYLIDRDMEESGTSCTADSGGMSDGTCTAVTLATVIERHGRLRTANAFGSELLPLAMTARAEYYNGSGWVMNTDDNCTTLSAAPTSPRMLTPGCADPADCSTSLTCGGAACATTTPVLAGDLRLLLSAPNAAGYVDLTLDVPAWLEFPWRSATAADPMARATFGIYKGNERVIYRRERY